MSFLIACVLVDNYLLCGDTLNAICNYCVGRNICDMEVPDRATPISEHVVVLRNPVTGEWWYGLASIQSGDFAFEVMWWKKSETGGAWH